MAERKWNWDREDDLPVYLARPGTADQVPRQLQGGFFCNVEGAYESKTIDFDSLSVGQRGSRTPRTPKTPTQTSPEAKPTNAGRSQNAGKANEAELDGKEMGVQIKMTRGKEVLQNLDSEKVSQVQNHALTGMEITQRNGLNSIIEIFYIKVLVFTDPFV